MGRFWWPYFSEGRKKLIIELALCLDESLSDIQSLFAPTLQKLQNNSAKHRHCVDQLLWLIFFAKS
jgi:hypothetical protein